MMKPLSMEPGAVYARAHRRANLEHVRWLERQAYAREKECLFDHRLRKKSEDTEPKELDFED